MANRNRRESSGGMERLGVWNCIFSGSEISDFGAWNLSKIAVSAEFQGFPCKFRPLKNIFRTLENGHSIRHQSIPPLSASRRKDPGSRKLCPCIAAIVPLLRFSTVLRPRQLGHWRQHARHGSNQLVPPQKEIRQIGEWRQCTRNAARQLVDV